MSTLAALAETSQRVTAASGRRAKVAVLAELLKSLAAGDVEIGAHYLSGTLRQGRIGAGFAQLQAALPVAAAREPTLTLSEVDAALQAFQGVRGTGAAARRSEQLRELLARATAAERDFLLRLLSGELRQDAMGGLMVEAIAAAAGLPLQQVRRAAMYAGDLFLPGAPSSMAAQDSSSSR